MHLLPHFSGLWFIAISISITGCSDNVIPDLSRLYHTPELPEQLYPDTQDNSQPPVIVIHGAFGSRLSNKITGAEYWPGNFWHILTSDYKKLAYIIDEKKLEPRVSKLASSGITDQVIGNDYYGAILRTLENAGGYTRGIPGTAPLPESRQYYVLTYDWREDNVLSARKLDDLIEQIRKDYASPDLKVDIVAHSMGGMITRYYLRYGRDDVLDGNNFTVTGYGFKRINKVVLLGTPNFGSVSAVLEILQGLKVGLNRIPTEVMLTWPSTYQLLPHPLNDSMVTLDGKVLDRDFFDTNIWQRFQWSLFDPEVRQHIIENKSEYYYNLLVRYFNKYIERGRRFAWSLSVPAPEPHINYIVFGGDCELTPARLLVEEVNGESMVRLYPDDIKNPQQDIDYDIVMLQPGDGRVTKSSLLARDALNPTIPRHRYSHFPLDYAMMLCEKHDTLTGNIHFQDNLLNVLLTNE